MSASENKWDTTAKALASSDGVVDAEAAHSTLIELWEYSTEAGIPFWDDKWKLVETALKRLIATEPSGEGFVRLSDWVGQLEAARESIAARWRRYSQERMDEPEAMALYEAMTALDRLIDMDRCRSQNNQAQLPHP